MGEPGTLIKFGQKEHLMQLQDEGLFYMNHLPYFWGIEDEELRGDPFDCIAEVARGPKIGFTLANVKEVFMEGNWTLRMYPPEPEKINIFCMYALRPFIEGTFPVDERNFRFGEHALVLINRDEFMRRIESTLKSHRIRAKADLVEYVDDKYTGKLGSFRKLKRFAYQSEWRLVCYDGPGEPRDIQIGSIRDISAIICSYEVNKEIRVDLEQDGALDRR
jgi:hypothetical protein